MKLKKISLLLLLFITLVGCDVFLGEDDTIVKSTPTGVAASEGETDQIIISWDDHNYFDHTGLNIYRSDSETTGFTLLSSTTDGTTRYVDESILPAKTYYYYVAYEYGSEEGEPSSNVSGYSYFDTQDYEITYGYEALTFTWEERDGIDFYRLYEMDFDLDEAILVVDNIEGTSVSYTPDDRKGSFQLAAVVGDVEGTLTDISFHSLSYLSSPDNFLATENVTEITLTWDSVTDADYYKISYYSGSETSDEATILADNLTETSYIHTTPNYTESNNYILTAHTDGGGTSRSALEIAYTLRPQAPENLSSERVDWKKLKITWDSVPGINTYKIYREDTGWNGEDELIKTVTDVTEVTANGYSLTHGDTYKYYIKSVIGGKESFGSSRLSYTHTTKPIIYDVVDSIHGPFIIWEKGSIPSGFKVNVYRSTTYNGPYTIIMQGVDYLVGDTADYIVDLTNPAKNDTYYYKISAEEGVNETEKSGYDSVYYKGSGSGL